MNEFVEAVAAAEHERWVHWQRHLHSVCERQPDGSLVIPAGLVRRWERQMEDYYDDLSESEKESDRQFAREILQLIQDISTDRIRRRVAQILHYTQAIREDNQ